MLLLDILGIRCKLYYWRSQTHSTHLSGLRFKKTPWGPKAQVCIGRAKVTIVSTIGNQGEVQAKESPNSKPKI